MSKAFLDSSTFFAAVLSPTGPARMVLELADRGELAVVISSDVIIEVERNLLRKAPQLVRVFLSLLDQIAFEVFADPPKEDVWAAEVYVASKDAFIVAAAINAGADYLVTHDRKHLIDPPEVAGGSGLTIVTPGELLKLLE